MLAFVVIRRIAALALLVGLLLVGWFVGLSPLLHAYHAKSDAITDLQREEQRYLSIAQQATELEARTASVRQRTAGVQRGFIGKSDDLIAARLQNKINQIVETAGGELHSTQIQPVITQAGFRRISLRIQITARIDALYEVLYAVERQTPYLFVDSLVIKQQGIKAGVRRRQLQHASRIADQLLVRLDLYGYARQEAG